MKQILETKQKEKLKSLYGKEVISKTVIFKTFDRKRGGVGSEFYQKFS